MSQTNMTDLQRELLESFLDEARMGQVKSENCLPLRCRFIRPI